MMIWIVGQSSNLKIEWRINNVLHKYMEELEVYSSWVCVRLQLDKRRNFTCISFKKEKEKIKYQAVLYSYVSKSAWRFD